ncbi:MAG: hypothetical protein ACKO2P_07680 [Planctomycetota bacterium]
MQPARRQPRSPSPDGAVPESDAKRARQEKLEAIRRAVEAGLYDNDEILELAFNRMLQKVQSEGHAD